MELDKLSLAGKVAVVTGGRRGLGKAIAISIAKSGASVAVCDRVVDDGQLEAVASEIQRHGVGSLAVGTDITKKSEIDDMVQRVVDSFGRIDILVNNAAMNIRAPLLELLEDGWDKVIDTDLKGYFLCCQAVGKKMIERRSGNIINIASTAAMKSEKQMGVYCIAKSGVVMLTRVLAQELAEYCIRVNAIAPYMVKTKFSQPLWGAADTLRHIEATIPLGRLGETDDITGTVLFLASEASSYMTGHTVIIDGGLSA
jgi:NAD(P)-dependent dehydrogenase (short-subunit alcohol dehydrogenase family)